MNFDSPSAAAIGALGIGGGLDIGLDNVGVGGLVGLQGLGVMGTEQDRLKMMEDERLRRLDAVIEILSRKKGYVSEEGLERLVDRIGLDRFWDDIDVLQADGKTVKMRNLVVAGRALQLDIALDSHIVRRVALAFPLSKNINIAGWTSRAEAILLKDLELEPGQSPLTKTLDKFFANLERLATLDKLSAMPWLDLQEGLAGIYTALRKIHEWDMERLLADPAMAGKGQQQLLNIATCDRHGYPAMHERERVGLNLDYWMQRHLLEPPKTQAMQKWVARHEGLWSISIGCAAMDTIAYSSVRISDAWISSMVEKVDPGPEDMLHATTGTVLDWLEPVPTMNEETKEYPEVIFRAVLEPPVTIPYHVWQQMLQIMGIQENPTYRHPTFDSLFFPILPSENHDPTGHRTVEHWRDVLVRSRTGGVSTRRHKNMLYVHKPVYAVTLSEMPFSHPKQLVAQLPTLRQYALLATLLKRSFGTNNGAVAKDTAQVNSSANGPSIGPNLNGSSSIQTPPPAESSSEPSPPSPQPAGDDKEGSTAGPVPQHLHMDVTLTMHPAPRLNIIFPIGAESANINLEVAPNGKISVLSQNIVPEDGANAENCIAGKGKGKQYTTADLGRLLEYFEDLDEWCQWIMTRVV
jgi:hypothetical protein